MGPPALTAAMRADSLRGGGDLATLRRARNRAPQGPPALTTAMSADSLRDGGDLARLLLLACPPGLCRSRRA
jgi:hypothetical protein